MCATYCSREQLYTEGSCLLRLDCQCLETLRFDWQREMRLLLHQAGRAHQTGKPEDTAVHSTVTGIGGASCLHRQRCWAWEKHPDTRSPCPHCACVLVGQREEGGNHRTQLSLTVAEISWSTYPPIQARADGYKSRPIWLLCPQFAFLWSLKLKFSSSQSVLPRAATALPVELGTVCA